MINLILKSILNLLLSKRRNGALVFFYCSMAVLPWGISCQKELNCDHCIAGNRIPVANAGPDQRISLPLDSTWLDASASSDPDGKIVEWHWSRISGPYSISIVSDRDSVALVRDLTVGTYEFEIRIKDNGGLLARDTMVLSVSDPDSPNSPPVAVAGNDTSITLPVTSIYLDGSRSHDAENNIVSFEWSMIPDGSNCSFANVYAARTEVRELEPGAHRFVLKVIDAFGLFSRDTVTVTLETAEQHVALCSNLNRPMTQAYLRELGQLSKSRYGAAIAAAGNKIVIAGGQIFPDSYQNGWAESWGTSRVDIYDVSSNSWSIAELSKPRFGIAAIAAGSKIFFAGGESGDGAYNAVYSNIDIYDVSTGTWTVAFLSIPRSYLSAAVVNNKVIFAGGEINDYQATNQVDMYDLQTNSMTTQRLSEARGGITAVTVGNKVYFAGGWVTRYWDYIPSKTIDIYDYSSDSWSATSLKELSGSLAGLNVNDKIFWANGCKVEIWDVNTDKVSFDSMHREDFWEVDEGRNGLLVKNKAIFYGYSPSIEYKDFDIYDVSTSTWSIGTLENLPAVGSSVIAVNGDIYVIGGLRSSTVLRSMPQIWKLEY